MKSTGTEYMSSERTPTVLPEFSELLPPLTDEQLSLLEADILKNGCYSPIIVNEDLVVVDGHNRMKLCEKHDLPYRMVVFSFDDDLEAKQWALDTQKSRRNLTVNELCKIALKLRPEIEARAKERQSGAGGDKYGEKPLMTTLSEAVSENKTTRKELADAVGVGEVTMGKAMKIEDEAPQPVKEAVDKSDITIHEGYNITKQVQELPEDEQEAAAAEAVAVAIANKQDKKRKKIDADTKTAKLFCTAFEKGVLIEATEENVRAWLDYAGIRFEHFDGMISDARQISDAFAAIADIIENSIKPGDWRNDNESIEAEPAEEFEGSDIDDIEE